MEKHEGVIRDGDQKSSESFGHEQGCSEDASKGNDLESSKAEMNEVREENTRLKMLLEQVKNDYKSLQMRFIDIFHQKSTNITNSGPSTANEDHHTEPEPDLVSLRLGMNSNGVRKDSANPTSSNKQREDDEFKDGLKLGLDCNFGGLDVSPHDSSEEMRREKIAKKTGEDEASEGSSVKRARVSVRARCDAPTMHDGCQWRKYGQKIAKGNPCPRAYYRCTVAPSCPVRKQVQRCAQDMSILITTYEGTHNHSLPISAAAMASTTSAAASMLLSGSSSTAQPSHGLNHPNFSTNSSTRPLYLSPNTPNPSFPTITLDLTTTNSPNPSRTLNFSSQSNMAPAIWGNGYLNYGTHVENLYKDSCQPPLTESLTRAITTDPNFRSVIMAAISSVVGGSSGNQGGEVGGKMTI